MGPRLLYVRKVCWWLLLLWPLRKTVVEYLTKDRGLALEDWEPLKDRILAPGIRIGEPVVAGPEWRWGRRGTANLW